MYEPFLGSGTTIIAAEMTGRACHAIEIDPPYVDVAVERWQAFTGEPPCWTAMAHLRSVAAERHTGSQTLKWAAAPISPILAQRRQVEAMAAYGIPETDISRVLGIDPKTLRKYYRDELDLGQTKANAQVAGFLFTPPRAAT